MYDFTTRVDRRGTGSAKWDGMCRADPSVPEGVVPLSVADMEFVAVPEVVTALQDFVAHGVFGYTDPTDAYYEAVLSWQRTRHGWDARREWVALSAGVVPAIGIAIEAFTQPGDGVVIMTPVYHPFRMRIEGSGRRVCDVPLLLDEPARSYSIDFEALERACSDPATTMLLLCSPHNPVGRVWTAGELERVARICCAHGVFVVADEIHADLVLPGFHHTVFAQAMPEGELGNCAICTAPSKTFNLAGIQCSNIFIPDADRRAAFKEAAGNKAFFHELNAFAYRACQAAYEQGSAWLDEAIDVIASNYRLLVDFCAERLPMLKVYPLEGTYLAWVDCRGLGLAPADLAAFMTGEARLFLDEGAIFGVAGAGFERINIACPREVLLESLKRLEKAVAGLPRI